MSVVFSPFIGQIGRVENYVSLEEVKFSPTASALDFSNLVESGSPGAQDRALYELIVRASGKVDAYCMGRLGTLNATSFTQNGRYRTDRQGRFKIHPSFTPVLAVTAFSFGTGPGTLSPVSLTSSNVWPEEESIIILPWNSPGVTATYSGTSALSSLVSDFGSGEYYTTFTYINGYPNTFTTTSTPAGSSSIPVVDATGYYPGTTATFWDGVNDEVVEISSTYVPGSTTLTLTNPTQYKHGINVNISQLHSNIKQACIHFVVSMVKERGQGGGFQIATTGEVIPETGTKGGGFTDDELQAYDLLDEFKTISGRL